MEGPIGIREKIERVWNKVVAKLPENQGITFTPIDLNKETMKRQNAIYAIFPNRGYIKSPKNLKRVDYPDKFDSTTQQTYVFNTENMDEYISQLNFHEKEVLAVSGNADFAINAFSRGAKNVSVVDISPVACFMGELKLAGLKVFTYEEFLNFFATQGDQTFKETSFSFSQYQKIRPLISSQAGSYFDQLIMLKGNSDYLAPGSLIIDKLEGKMEYIRNASIYMQNKENYAKAQQKIKDVLFYPQDIRLFLQPDTKRDFYKMKKYGMIYLSNVLTYLDEGLEDTIIQNAIDVLTAEGSVLIFSFFSRRDNQISISFINEREKRWQAKGMKTGQIIGNTHSFNKGFSLTVLTKSLPVS